MSEETSAEFHREGGPAFGDETTAEDTAAESQSEEGQEGETQSAEGENTQTEDEKPFHEHPRWLERERDWTERFNSQEVRHQNELKTAIESIRTEFGAVRKENAEATQIPSWFGGSQEQWDAYRRDRDAEIASAETRAYERLKGDTVAQEQAVKQATEFMQSEIAAIEGDKTLNPKGEKIDPEALFKIVLENQLVDTQGRWNYRAGYQLLKGSAPAPVQAPDTRPRKEVAAATSSESRAETKPKEYATSTDFTKDRPW